MGTSPLRLDPRALDGLIGNLFRQSRTRPLSTPCLLLVLLVAVPETAASQPGRFANSEAVIAPSGRSATIAHEGGRIELEIIRVDGSPRLSASFIDRNGRRDAPPATVLSFELVTGMGRLRRIPFHGRDGRMWSTTPVERLTSGSVLSVVGSHGRRIKLLKSRGTP